MASITFIAPVDEIRGRLGGVVFSRNKSGNHIRPFKQPSNPQSTLQMNQRGTITSMIRLWQVAGPTNQATWVVWAALPANVKYNSLGAAYYLSGYQSFLEINTRIWQIYQDWRWVAPDLGIPAVPVITSVTWTNVGGTPTLRVNYGAGEFSSTQTIVVHGSAWPWSARLVQYSRFYLLKQQLNPGASPYQITTQITDRWGPPHTGDRIFVRVYKQTSEGQRSAPYTAYATYA